MSTEHGKQLEVVVDRAETTALPKALAPVPVAAISRSLLCAVGGLLLLLLMTGGVRWRFLSMPLERDEGEFAYGAQRVLAGEWPYVSFHAMKLPGIYAVYAAIEATFGQTDWAIHLGLLIANLSSLCLMFWIGTRLYDTCIGWIAAAGFAILSLSPAVHGTQAEAEHFVVVAVLAGVALLISAHGRSWWYFTAGIAFGLALVIKQHGAPFGACAILWCCVSRQWRSMALLTLGYLLPFGVTCLLFSMGGAWEQFVLWNWTIPRGYLSRLTWYEGLGVLRDALREQFTWGASLWGAALIGICVVALCTRYRRHGLLIGLFCVASVIAVSPGMYYRPHYFVLMLPAVALLSAIGIRGVADRLPRSWRGSVTAVLCLAALGWPTWRNLRYMLRLTPNELMAEQYTGFFRESREVAEYLAKHTEEPLAIIGSEPQVFFYARRESVSPEIYMYPLTERQQPAGELQRQFIRDVEQARPAYLLYAADEFSWALDQDADRSIFDWLQSYLSLHYFLVGRLELQGKEPALQRWGEELSRPEQSPIQWLIFRRRAE